MKKIPNVFFYESDFRGVSPVFRPENLWVRYYGIATEKVDGTNVRVTVRAGKAVRVEKRRNPKPLEKAEGIIDPWYTDANLDNPADKWIFKAVEGSKYEILSWPEGEHCCEAIGPKINGNPWQLNRHQLYPFHMKPIVVSVPDRTFEGIKRSVLSLKSFINPEMDAEGIVFALSSDDKVYAKIRRKDFPQTCTTTE